MIGFYYILFGDSKTEIMYLFKTRIERSIMDTNLYPVCELTAEQKKAFNKLKKVYKECEKAGIYFVNCYGDLMAFDKRLVAGYGDALMPPDGVYQVELHGSCPAHFMRIANEWADDDHVLGLTKEGMELYLSDEE